MRKLLNILAATVLVATPAITVVSCRNKGNKQTSDKYKDPEVEKMPNGPLKQKILQTTLFSKMAIANRHENLNSYTPSILQMLTRLPDSYKDKDGNLVDVDYYRGRYLNQKDGMPLKNLTSTYDYMNILNNNLYNTENQTKSKIPGYSEHDKLPTMPTFAANNNMLNYWYDGGALSNYSIAKEILPTQAGDARVNSTITDAYNKAMFEMPRTTYFYDLNMNYNPLATKDIKFDTETNSNFVINGKKFATGQSFITAEKSEEQDKLMVILQLISMADMFTDRSQSKTYINQLNKFLPLSSDGDGTFFGSILGQIYYNIFGTPTMPNNEKNPNYDMAKKGVSVGLTSLGATGNEKAAIEKKVNQFFDEQAQIFSDLLLAKPMADDLDLSKPEDQMKNRDAMWNGKTPKLQLADLLYKKDSSSKSLAELFVEFGNEVDGWYTKATVEQQGMANDAVGAFLAIAAQQVTPGFKVVLQSMAKMMKSPAIGGLGTLTINDMNKFVVSLSQGILDNKEALTKASQIPWSDPKKQEQNQTEIAKLLTGSEDPTKPAPGSFMDVVFTWFNDDTKPVRSLLNKLYFDPNSETRKDLLAINNALYDYTNTLLLGENWFINNGKFLNENNMSYDLEYKGMGDADVAANLNLHEKWYVPKAGINTYQDLNAAYLKALGNYDLDWFAKYDGLGNNYQKVNYKYTVTWTNVNPGDDSHQYWVISNIQWFAKDGNGQWKRHYDVVQND
ncbi:lipoprotein [Spiroplasma sp. SV19]|uniref:lipoprotein n=1 Tax=Spiroplasma sp. SV19 TaxID=2570468 RepID=UPI0024B76D32|nr:lipoprotein [Spiroplasma sp. SV19]WHQ37442.1 hypothetical protein E7Y35_06295 [Spiroplasma sp. SV19]